MVVNSPKFSIIIPVYNVAPYLRECLDSVLAQTFADWEAICVDDGSTDGSGAILDEYATKDERFRVIHQANAGVSAARNAALDVARGEWVWFVDGDDVIHLHVLEHICGLIEKCPIARQVTILPMPSDQMSLWEFKSLDLSIFDYRLSDPAVVDSVTYRRLHKGACSTIHRREIVGQIRFRRYTINEDVLFSMTLFWRNRRVVVSDATAYYYRQREGAALNRLPSLRGTTDFMEVELELMRMIRENAHYWTPQSMHDCLAWSNTFDFYTLRGMFFGLSNSERTKCLGIWLKLQRATNGLLQHNRRYRFYWRLISILPIGSFAYCVVTRGNAFFDKWHRLKRKVHARLGYSGSVKL